MAVYEYRCRGCGKVFELLRPMSEADAPAKCPKCGRAGERLISIFASTDASTIRVPAREAFRAPAPATNRHGRNAQGKAARPRQVGSRGRASGRGSRTVRSKR